MTAETTGDRSDQAPVSRKPALNSPLTTAIGIGCLWFGVTNDDDDDDLKFEPKAHLQNIKEALESVDNISDVEVGGNTRYSSFSWADDDDEGGKVIPLFSDAFISFSIFMPARLKEKYGFGRPLGPVDVEYFQVMIVYDRGLPVTYVTYDIETPTDKLREHSPSTAIVFIRKYLEEKLASHEKVSFNIIGPSPFHADFFASSGKDTKEVEVEDFTKVGDGYRTILFKTGKDENEAFSEFVERYTGTLSSYYDVIRYRSASIHLLSKIRKGMSTISNITGDSPLKRNIGVKRQAELIDELLNAIIREKINRFSLANFLMREKEEGTIKENDILYRFFEREAKDSNELPLEDIKQLINILEDRRQGYLANRAVLISGLLGGIFGALFGAAFTFYLSVKTFSTLMPPQAPISGVSPSEGDQRENP